MRYRRCAPPPRFSPSAALAALGSPSPRPRRRRRDRDRYHRHDLDRGVKGSLAFVAPTTVTKATNSKSSTRPTPKGRPAHLLAGHAGLRCRNRGTRKNCFTPSHICLAIAKWQGVNHKGKLTINPAKAGPAGWSTMGTDKPGDSWFTGEKKGGSLHPAGDRANGRTQAVVHVRDPSLDARQGHGPAAPAASDTSEHSASAPRQGRRAFLGALGGGALAALGCRLRRRRLGLLGGDPSPRASEARAAAPCSAPAPSLVASSPTPCHIPSARLMRRSCSRPPRRWLWTSAAPLRADDPPPRRARPVTFATALAGRAGQLLVYWERRRRRPVRRSIFVWATLICRLLLLPRRAAAAPPRLAARRLRLRLAAVESTAGYSPLTRWIFTPSRSAW